MWSDPERKRINNYKNKTKNIKLTQILCYFYVLCVRFSTCSFFIGKNNRICI